MLSGGCGPGVSASAHPLPLRTLLFSAFHISAASHSMSNVPWSLLAGLKFPLGLWSRMARPQSRLGSTNICGVTK